MYRPSFQIQSPQALPRYRCNPKVVPSYDQSLRSEEWFLASDAAVLRKGLFSIACDGFNSAGSRVDSAHAMILKVRDVDVVLCIQLNTMRMVEPCHPGRA